MEYGLGKTISPTRDWQFNCRGHGLRTADFETKLLNRTNGNSLSAVLVLPVAAYRGTDGTGERVAEYPVFAAVAIDRDGLEEMMRRGVVTVENIYQTLSDASAEVTALNRLSQKAHDDHYDAGRLTTVQTWDKVDTDATPSIKTGPAANSQTAPATKSRRLFS
jgi:hypothetical protein